MHGLDKPGVFTTVSADETSINIKGENQYVWTFTDGNNVVFKLRASRELTVAHEFLADYDGILISDFYPGYDSVQCQQQKCWVHLIRDLNDDLWRVPFNTEFEYFVLEVRNLIIPMMETIQIYGLRKLKMNKFKRNVDIFYEKMIMNKNYKSDLLSHIKNVLYDTVKVSLLFSNIMGYHGIITQLRQP